MNNTISIYVHIPFCIKKCPYCDFNSIATADIPDDVYTNALIRELLFQMKEQPVLSRKTLETIYIGGGTPSLISPHNVKRLIRTVMRVFAESNPVETTMETNPRTITKNSLAAFMDAGINRLSIGIQSFNDKTLNALGRAHSADNSLQCYEYTRAAGFNNIGIDLMFGAPGQSIEDWEGDLKTAANLRPEHISAYNLTLEKGTLFFELQKNSRLVLPSEEEQVLMYELAIDSSKEAGYNHYEISNFSLPGSESRHNIRYWSSMDYIGLGAGAHSYISSPDWGIRWWNESNPDAYMQQINKTGQGVAGKEKLTKNEALEEGIFLGLRRTSGINMDWFAARFNTPLKNLCHKKIAELKTCGLIYEDGSIIKLTRKGLVLSNEVISGLI
jgi:oxygen-independent coproporphyrinogen III oxidase